MDFLLHNFLKLIHKYQKKMRPKRIILVRHGNSVANNNYDILQRVPDNKVHLSEKGIKQAKEAGQRLKQIIGNESIQFYVSPYTRTKETYENIMESFKDNYTECIYVTSLREQEYGNLQREMDKQFEEQKKVGVFFYRFINGESGADVHARMSIFLQYLFRRILSIDYHSFDNIVIVSHELTIKFFMMNFMNLPVTELDNIKKEIIKTLERKNKNIDIINFEKFYVIDDKNLYIKKNKFLENSDIYL